MRFTIKQCTTKGIKPGTPLVFKDYILFLKNLLENLVKQVGENAFYHLSQNSNTNAIDLDKKRIFFPVTFRIAWEKLSNVYIPKRNFIIH